MPIADPNYRYFVATPGGQTDRALRDMERAADEILAAFRDLDKLALPVEPVQIRAGAAFKGITMLPPEKSKNVRKDALEWHKALLRDWSANTDERETLGHGRAFLHSIPGFLKPERVPTFDQFNEMQTALYTIIDNVPELGLDPNIAGKIAEMSPKPPSKAALPEKAVLRVGEDIPIYPEAYKVFAEWVVKLPAVIEQRGNDYMPPDCTPLTPKALDEKTEHMVLESFRHEHAIARTRILGLPRFDVPTPAH
ncbi:MAG: hypothetical protein KGI97_07940 [Alphaproteobacteria bacterium]|nr:hypothetical protein [Alphaproteobacteria bacterium]